MPSAATYAKMHRTYLQNHQPKVFKSLQESGELNAHVRAAGLRAMQQYESLEAQMISRINGRDLSYPEKVKELEQIPHVVEEIVLDGLNSL